MKRSHYLRGAFCALSMCALLLVIIPANVFAHNGEEHPVVAESGSNSGEKTPAQKREELRIKTQELNERAKETKSAFASRAAEIKNNREEMKEKIEDTREEMKEKRDELASKAAAMREKIKDDRCKIINERIDKNAQQFENRKQDHSKQYLNAKKRIDELVTKLKAQGVDTSKLTADSVKLQTLIDQMVANYNAYYAALKETKNYTCGHSEGEFKAALEKSRDLLSKARQSAIEVRNYYQSTIRPDIEALKAQLRALKSASPSASAN